MELLDAVLETQKVLDFSYQEFFMLSFFIPWFEIDSNPNESNLTLALASTFSRFLPIAKAYLASDSQFNAITKHVKSIAND